MGGEIVILMCVCVYVCVGHSVMSDSETPRTVDREDPLSMGFPRQEYWSRLPQKT